MPCPTSAQLNATPANAGSEREQESLQQPDLLQGFPALADALIDPTAVADPHTVLAESGVKFPVARVRVDSTLPHLDRAFDYRVPPQMSEDAVPGARVRVHFNGQRVSGFIVKRADSTDYPQRLLPLLAVLSRVPAVAPQVFELADALAERYASTVANVLRLAVAPRIAALDKKYAGYLPGFSELAGLGAEHDTTRNTMETEKTGGGSDQDVQEAEPVAVRKFLLGSGLAPFTVEPVAPCDTGAFADYENGPEFIDDLSNGEPARAVLNVLPAHPEHDWADLLAIALVACASGGRGAIGVVPDQKSLDRLEYALGKRAPAGAFVRLSSGQKPHGRYHSFLRARLGLAPIVIGTRAAAYAPVANLGLVACWDDGDASLVELRAPYCHARDVLLVRAQQSGAAALFAGYALSSEAARLVRTRWATYVSAPRQVVREFSPRVHSTGHDYQLARDPLAAVARVPQLAFVQARKALQRGPVLVQVARSGYVPSFLCQRCRMPARCQRCRGPLALSAGSAVPGCVWCGRLAQPWRCGECGFDRWRTGAVGALRTAEELGRAFPNVPVVSSSGDHVRARVGAEPALVVATPGAEPVAEGGYAAALLLDADAMLRFDSLRAPEAALRRWFNAAALVRSAAEGGVVVTTASPSSVEQALVRWDPAGFARFELGERAELGLPPAVRTAAVTGSQDDVNTFLSALELPEGVRVTGPVPLDTGLWQAHHDADEEDAPQVGDWRAILFFSYRLGAQVTHELRAVRASQAALHRVGTVQVRCDGLDIL